MKSRDEQSPTPGRDISSRHSIKEITASLLALSVVFLSGGSFAQGADYHPSTIRIDVPGVAQSDPFSVQHIVGSKVFWMFPSVVQATVETAQFIQYMKVAPGETVLDIGTGSGVLAVFAAKHASRVVATDLSAVAVDNARYNARQHQLDHIIEVRQGDLFSPLVAGEKFDVILFNIGNPVDEATGEGSPFFWSLHERFLSEVKQYLQPGGRVYYHGGFLSNLAATQEMAGRHSLKIVEMHMWTAKKRNAEPLLFVLQESDRP